MNLPDSTLLEYWREERSFPDWFRQSTEVWHQTEEQFLEFCRGCWRITEINKRALIYVEPRQGAAEVHFSLKRGTKIETLISEFENIRSAIFEEFPIIIGWVNKRNSGLKAICRELGLNFYGVTMVRGQSHGKVIEWEAFTAFRQDFL